jgi:dihydropteroate synthase
VAQATRFETEGADIIDVGGMSTRLMDEILRAEEAVVQRNRTPVFG